MRPCRMVELRAARSVIRRRLGGIVGVLGLCGLLLPGCAPAPVGGSLQPTLQLSDQGGGKVAMQNGIPVPTFDWQPRSRIDLDGSWKVERGPLDSELSLTDRAAALPGIVREAAGREDPEYDDASWQPASVPGTINPPPRAETGAWYRRSFTVPDDWRGRTVTLKFGAVNYLADVWLNGGYLGYHEGGYTPFAFDATNALRPGAPNLIAVRVDNPPWGTRGDIVPWGLADWWNYGGITRPVWMEAGGPVQAVRADVVPHLDGADISVVVWNHGSPPAAEGSGGSAAALPPGGTGLVPPAGSGGGAAVGSEPPAPHELGVRLDILPAQVTPANLFDPDVRSLVPPGSEPLASSDVGLDPPPSGTAAIARTSFLFGGADHWSPSFPALFVLHVVLTDPAGIADELWTTFGLRRIAVDPTGPRLQLNGVDIFLRGVGIHDETIKATDAGAFTGTPATSPAFLAEELARAREVGATLLRTGHTPANPLTLMLADRLGFAVWEEIPLYHDTPLSLQIAMRRGIPQQMLREMALRDFDRPSVLFHGLANESLGGSERTTALRDLVAVDRAIDGTRLTGQAAYGSQPTDPSQAPLDVVGFTMYYGVFYGTDAATGTAQALSEAHAANPTKPIVVLEYGRWSSGQGGPAAQREILTQTYPELALRAGTQSGGYVAGAVWWTLDDFLTLRPGIAIESFGLYDPAGRPRPSALAAANLFGQGAGRGAEQQIQSGLRTSAVQPERVDPLRNWRLLGYLGYAIAIALAALGLLTFLLSRGGGRASTPSRPAARQ